MHRKNLIIKKERINRTRTSLKEKFKETKSWPIYFQEASISEETLKLSKSFAKKKKLLTLPVILGSEPKLTLESKTGLPIPSATGL